MQLGAGVTGMFEITTSGQSGFAGYAGLQGHPILGPAGIVSQPQFLPTVLSWRKPEFRGLVILFGIGPQSEQDLGPFGEWLVGKSIFGMFREMFDN